MSNDEAMRAHDALIKKLDGLLDKDKFLRRVLLDMHDTLDQRIFDEGNAASGQNFSAGLTSKTGKTGDYSKWYGRKREKKGRQIEKVDLQFTNEFRKDWTLVINKREYGHGFKRARGGGNNIHNADLSEYLEKKYQKDIFKLSESERNHLSDLLGKNIKIEFK